MGSLLGADCISEGLQSTPVVTVDKNDFQPTIEIIIGTSVA